MKKLRKQLRVADVTEFLAFETFPIIRYVEKMYRTEGEHHTTIVGVINYITGELIEFPCTCKFACKIFVTAVNKMLKETAKYLKEDK